METIDQLLNSRPRAYGRHYKISPASDSLAFDRPGQPYVDRANMSATAVISTATIDRVGDLLVPVGCHLENYCKNPVVLWAHGLEGIGQPIGTSRDSAGNVAVTISEDTVEATSWFSQSSLEAAQIFELIDEGIVRATSVRETPIKSHVRQDPQWGDVVVVEEWDLEEWSWCAVGVNPDAVAKALVRNRLGGQPIIPSLVKSLRAVSPTIRRFGVGLPMEKTVTDVKSLDEELDTMPEDDAIAEDGEMDDVGNQPYGATVVSAVHASLAGVCQNIEDAIGPLENPLVKEGLQAILSALQDQMVALEGLHTSNYPDQPTLKDECENSDDDDSAMKAFLASGQVASLQVLGLGSRLRNLVAARNLTAGQRRTLNGISHQFANLVARSKAFQADRDGEKIQALQKSNSELTGLVAVMNR